jgi:hypothetical protein
MLQAIEDREILRGRDHDEEMEYRQFWIDKSVEAPMSRGFTDELK